MEILTSSSVARATTGELLTLLVSLDKPILTHPPAAAAQPELAPRMCDATSRIGIVRHGITTRKRYPG